MRRREFIVLLGGAVASLPFAARAQQAVPVIGFLASGSPDDQANLTAATRQGLKEAGYIEGQNLTIEYRWAEGHYDRLPALAAELVNRGVALIIATGGSDPGRAAKVATSAIPIVFITAADPVKTGLVASLNRPEANVTGISMIGAALESKRLELLHEMAPQVAIISVLINPNYPAAKAQTQEVQEAALRLGIKLVLQNASTEAEIDAAFAGFVPQKTGALLACNDPFFGSQRVKLASLAIREKLPAISFRREFAEAGGLLSYGPLFCRRLSRSRRICRQDIERSQAGGSSGDAADQIRTGRQSQDRQGDRARDLRILPAPRRRNHRMRTFVGPRSPGRRY
jgi:putative tryptophan/tyrosine transport system substrate-binding protein